MNYLEYTVEEFVLDEYFQKWLLEDDSMAASFWKSWLEENPDKRKEIEEASQIVRSIHLTEELPTQEEFNKVWNDIILNRNGKEVKKPKNIKRTIFKQLAVVWKVAAMVLFATFVSLAIKHYSSEWATDQYIAVINEITKQTGTGERLTFQLPDGSIVKLNSNSKLTFPELFDGATRTVSLKGEAFFEITKDRSHPFRVITGNVGTQVLGTSFNVKAYDPKKTPISVAVVTGKVAVGSFKENKLTENLLLEPGQMARFDQSKNTFEKSAFVYAEVIGWKEGVLNFKNEDIISIVEYLESWYNVKFILNKQDLDRDKDFSGRYKNKTLDTVLKGLSYAYAFKYEIDNKIVIIK